MKTRLQRKEAFIRQKAAEHVPESKEKIYWSLHAIGKLRREKITKNRVEQALKTAVAIEDYSMEGRPLPGCLVLGQLDTAPLHAVVAIDEAQDRIFVITVYRPSSERWKDGCKKRKEN